MHLNKTLKQQQLNVDIVALFSHYDYMGDFARLPILIILFLFVQAVQWREEIDMKNCFNWEFPPYYKNEMAYQFYGRDYEGAPG